MKIGFAGLGVMGQVIVPRLLAAGHQVVGWNRTPGKTGALESTGMTVAATPRELAEGADMVISIVMDDAAVEAVALGDDGIAKGLRPGGLYIDMSTIAPNTSRRIAGEIGLIGAAMLDAPISAAAVTVTAGKASLMVGGDPGEFERAKPVLLAIGPTVTYIGGNGTACQMKIALNHLLMVEVVGFAEAIALAEQGGVKREIAIETVLKSVVAAPVHSYRAHFILDGQMPETPIAPVTLVQKDIQLALDSSRGLGSPVPLAAACNELMNACRERGLENRDFVTVFDVYRAMARSNP